MRIGELAALLGVSTRTVRHYHHQGVLPEPVRLSNGYREYGMRDAIALARVRRLVDLGLSLDEVRDVIADDRSRELPEILRDIDADLARQETGIRVRRARLADLLARADAGVLDADDTASPELVAFLRGVDAPASPIAAWDRDFLMLIDTMASQPERERVGTMFAPLMSDPKLVDIGRDFYRRLDELADARSDDPRIDPLAVALAEFTRSHLLTGPTGEEGPDSAWQSASLEPFLAELAPAQAEVVRRTVRLLGSPRPPAAPAPAPASEEDP
ncbi:MerR family transcriptional regulator [Yinghuangia sp. YIM S09857]|uniref:MerR family transcriptional regulator n=1 Tax=Yinghuangia sp. YIM S09857 TaxID=3436929 RepID=UPI003F532106